MTFTSLNHVNGRIVKGLCVWIGAPSASNITYERFALTLTLDHCIDRKQKVKVTVRDQIDH
jgi:hypothetical protein